MNSEILDQLTILEKNVDSEVTNPKRGRKKKMNEVDESDVKDRRERLVACVLSGNSKQYLRKEYTEQQISEMDCTNVPTNVNTLINRFESFFKCTKDKIIGQKRYKFIFKHSLQCARHVGNQQDLSNDLDCDPFLNTAMQRFTCNLYYRFGALLASVSVGIITGKHYAKILSLN